MEIQARALRYENLWRKCDQATISHTRELMGQGAKAVAIACNTATSAAVRILRQMYPQLPLVGIEPALKPAVLFKHHPTVLVMATP